jgi:hypothetical protein
VTRVHVGHLAFGIAFIVIGTAWLLRGADLGVDAAWLTAVAALALGAAGLVTTVLRVLR